MFKIWGKQEPAEKKFSLLRFILVLALFLSILFSVTFSISKIPLYFDKILTYFFSADINNSGINVKDSNPLSVLSNKQFTQKDVKSSKDNKISNAEKIPEGKLLITIGLLSDSHNSNKNLENALKSAKTKNVDYIMFLGDYTDVGSIDELTDAKAVMDASGLKYYSIPGDHDLWKSGGTKNFESVFGSRYGLYKLNGINFILLDNSDTQVGVDEKQMSWFKETLKSLTKDEVSFVLLANPLYNKNNFKLMGEHNSNVKAQADSLLDLIRKSHIKAVFAGDNHLSSKSLDPESTKLEHIVVGSLADRRNLQIPRFSILKIYEKGNYTYEEVVLDANNM